MDLVTRFIAQLQAPEEDARRGAAAALGTLADPRAIDALVAYLHDPAKADPPQLEYTTMMDYERYGEPPLPSVREVVIESLGEIGTKASVPPLVEALQERIRAIRYAAAVALGKVGDKSALEPLTQALNRAYWGEEERAILIALGQLHDPQAFEPLRQWLRRSVGAVIGLAHLGDLRAVPLLLPIAASPHSSSLGRAAALDALGRLGDKQAHETVIACLHDADGLVGTAAARALIRLGDAQDTEFLLPLLDEQQATPGALIALGTLGGERVFPILASRLQEAAGGRRTAIISALGATGDTRVIPLLLPILREENRYARSAAVEALGTLRATQAVEQIIPLLQDQDRLVRQNAARSLGQLGDARAVTPLLQALQDPDWIVPSLAALALGALGDARAIAPLQAKLHTLPSRNVYRQITRALERLQAASAPGEDHSHAEPTR